ncbi:Histone H2B [Eumeta japonica]|uniref:Histone H2B n=1 Tax=Eumeta variegata TaxID=151549 RepID=A0A4C1ZQ37_EUMVA|nr:Histone H2B [Eumeta japonica]
MPPKTSGKAAKKSGKAQKNISKSDKKRRSTEEGELRHLHLQGVKQSIRTPPPKQSARALQQTFDDNIEGGADPVRLLLPGELAKHAVSEVKSRRHRFGIAFAAAAARRYDARTAGKAVTARRRRRDITPGARTPRVRSGVKFCAYFSAF